MSEPEDVLLDGAHHATTFVRGLWSRRSADARDATLRLADLRPRLELFVRAACGVALPIAVAEPPAVPTWLGRLARRTPRHLVERRALPSTDGAKLRLPRTLPADGVDSPLGPYRLLAAALATRAARGTPALLPSDALIRDLYLARESAAVDRTLAAELPGLVPELERARGEALAARPYPALLTPQEAAVEAEVRSVLAVPLDPSTPERSTPADSLAWAERVAENVRSCEGPYRGLPAVALWGTVSAPPPAPLPGTAPGASDDAPPASQRVSVMDRRPQVREAPDDEDDEGVGMWMVQLDDPQEHVEDPMGLQRPTDRDDAADPDDLADSLSELPEARLVAAPGRANEVLASEDPPPARALTPAPAATRAGVVYPEWDYRLGAYHERGAVVREHTPPLGDAAWAEGVLARRAALLHAVRRRFERLRPRRLRLGCQLDGPEVDMAAYVDAYATRRAGHAGDDRLYEAVRPARRDVAIALLVDVSGSTDSWVSEDLRVIDVEKEALLVVCDALEALGDPYAILAFSGEGPEAVDILPLKAFAERNGAVVQRRIAGLEPDRYTRIGAALRHATALLMQKPAAHRLLLVLSDGKPNDVDRYEGRYGVEDARQAVAEARLQGLHPFCVTVDRHAPEYMPRIFGAGAYAVLHHPERLPGVLVDVLRRLVRP